MRRGDKIHIKPRAEPLYQKLFDDLRARILRGDFADGRYLPSESELEAKFGVSRITVVRALKELTLAGLVVREKGRGTRVRIAAQGTLVRGPSSRGPMQRQLLPAGARARDHDRQVKVLEFSRVRASADIAKALGVRAGTRVLRTVRILCFENAPYAHVTAFLRPDIGARWTAGDFERQTLAGLLEKSGIRIVRTEEEVTAIPASAAIGPLLEIDEGAPLIRISRTTYAADHSAVEHVMALHPPGRFRYAISTSHGHAGN